MENELVEVERVKAARIGSILWPAVNHQIKTTPSLLAREGYKMVEAQMLGNESGKTALAECDELISRQVGRLSSAKGGVVGGEVRSQAPPQRMGRSGPLSALGQNAASCIVIRFDAVGIGIYVLDGLLGQSLQPPPSSQNVGPGKSRA
jgi:hypothetical protein